MQNSPARLPDVGLGPRVGLPGRRQPAGYGTSWSVLVSSTSGRSGPSNRIYFTIFHPRTSRGHLDILRCHSCGAIFGGAAGDCVKVSATPAVLCAGLSRVYASLD